MMSRATHLRRRRYARWALVSFFAFLSLMALVLIAPAVVASGWIWPRVLARLTSDFDATVTTRQVSLGWFSPVELQGVEVLDADGQTAVEIEAVRTHATLLSLLWNKRDLGTVVLEQPTVTLEVRDRHTNLEQILARWLTRPAAAASGNLTVQVKDGALDLTDSSRTRVARLESMQLTVELPAGGAESGTVELLACPLTVHERVGSCAARCEWTGRPTRRNWSLYLHTRDAGLSLISLVARRFGTEVQADGALSAELQCKWDAATSVWTVNAPLAQLAPLHLAAPAWLGQDSLRWESLKVAGQAVLGNGRLRFSQVDTACDVGKFTLHGDLPWRPTSASGIWNDLLASAASATIELDGRVDLAQLARSFPRLLRIRAGVTVESGNVRVVLASNQTAAERHWTAHLETADLAAVAEGRRLTWDEPLQVDLVVSQAEADWQMQRLSCRSSFLQLAGRGDPRSGAYTLTCDLDRLTSELRPVFDLGGLRASGKLNGHLNWKREDQRIVADASSTIERLELVTPSGVTWREPGLQTNWNVEGEVRDAGVVVLQGGRGELLAGDDRLAVDLLEPVTFPGPRSKWVIGLVLRGQTATWLARLQPWWPFTGLEGNGALQVESTIASSGPVWDIRKLTARAEPLRVHGPALQIDEPKVLATLTGQWDADRQLGTIADGTWQSSALGLRATNVSLAWNGPRPQLAGDLSFRADLQRLHDAWSATAADRVWRLAGTAQGQVSLVQHAERTQARWTVDMTDTELSHRSGTSDPRVANASPAAAPATWQAVWHEPTLQWTGAGWHDATRDLLQLDRCELVAGTQLTVSVAGRVSEPAGRCDLDVQGHVRYDLAQLLPRIVATNSVRASGREMQEFWLRGPLFHPTASAVQPAAYSSPTPLGRLPAELCGLANLSWNSADMWGVPFGPGQLRARLDAGKVAADPLELPLSGGTLRITPQLDLNATPAMLSCTPGQVLSDITITPAMCQHWLKYVTPLAAEATRAEGKFSVEVRDAAVPLTQLANARIAGTLLVDSARLGPGPLSLQILQIVEQVRAVLERRAPAANSNTETAWVTIPRQQTQVTLERARVSHNQLDMLVGDTPIRTSGSVGLDQSLALVVQLTVQESWVAKDPRLALLQGTQLSIPVGGSLNQPRLDPRALEQLSAQVLQQSASRLIDQGIQRGLQELLGPRKK